MSEIVAEETLTPRQIVSELDRYIVGQHKAKRAVAIALRNRYRRSKLPKPMADEIHPKNILMIGPTGVGKTEIARRLSNLVGAPFVKVEATKFTEVGYVGRDVEGMIRDLVEVAVRSVRTKKMREVRERAAAVAEERLLAALVPLPKSERAPKNPLDLLFGSADRQRAKEESAESERAAAEARERRENLRLLLQEGRLEDELVEIDVEDSNVPMVEVFSGTGVEELGINFQDLLGPLMPKKRKRKRVSVKEAREILTQEESHKLIDMDAVSAEGLRLAEQSGIVFVDEIDKIAGHHREGGPDVSREGVQRDILPIIEGSTVVTKYGPVKTDHILFIAAGAFNVSKPSDLIPELQGRLPIRVELDSLNKDDFVKILTEPENALVKQYVALLSTEGVQLRFLPEAIEEIASLAAEVNDRSENIGARRLYAMMERILEDLSFEAPDIGSEKVVIDREYVRGKVAGIVSDVDLSRYIL